MSSWERNDIRPFVSKIATFATRHFWRFDTRLLSSIRFVDPSYHGYISLVNIIFYSFELVVVVVVVVDTIHVSRKDGSRSKKIGTTRDGDRARSYCRGQSKQYSAQLLIYIECKKLSEEKRRRKKVFEKSPSICILFQFSSSYAL